MSAIAGALKAAALHAGKWLSNVRQDRRWLLGNPNEGAAPEDVPDLFEMQQHCSFTGILATMVATGFFFWLDRSIDAPNVDWWPTASTLIYIFLGFFAAAWPIQWAGKRKTVGYPNSLTWLRLLSIVNIICMSVLLWATGTFQSPFVPLYTMTHALTLTRTTGRASIFVVFAAFAAPFSIVSAVGTQIQLMPEALREMAFNSRPYFAAMFSGVLASLVVSTASIAFIGRHRRNGPNSAAQRFDSNQR